MADVEPAQNVEGAVARDAPVSGNPVLSGGRASTAVPSAVSTDGDLVDAWHTLTGAAVQAHAIVAPSTVVWDNATATGTTLEIATAGMSTALMTLIGNGSLSGGKFFTEGWDGANWTSIAGTDGEYIQDFLVDIAFYLSNQAGLRYDISGYTKFRTRLSVAITAGTLTIAIQATAATGGLAHVDYDNASFLEGGSNRIAQRITMAGYVIQTSAGATLSDGQTVAARADSKRAQIMVIEDGTTRGRKAVVSSGGALSIQDSEKLADNAGFTDGTSKVMPAGFIFDETAGTALTENDIGASRIDSKRALVGVLEDATTRGQRAAISAAGRLSVDASGVAVPITDNSGSLTVDNNGTFAIQDSQVVADNAGFTDGTSKLFMAGYIFDETAGTALTENDAAAARIDSKRATVNVLEDGSTRGLRAGVVDETGSSAVDALAVGGGTPSDSVDSGNPVKIGFLARTSDITAVANADRVNAIADTLGKAVVLIGSVHDVRVTGTTNYTGTVAADVIAAVASTRLVVTSILVTNAHATVGTKVEIRDGTTVKIQGYAAPAGGGFVMSGGAPIIISTSGAAITARCVTTGADVDVSIQGYKIAN